MKTVDIADLISDEEHEIYSDVYDIPAYVDEQLARLQRAREESAREGVMAMDGEYND